MTDIITGVAVIDDTGQMIALPKPHRHHHLFATAALLGINLESKAIQGFITSKGFFVDRTHAMSLVNKYGQENKRSGNPDSKELFSEDVW